jgi:sulfatase maturation enzyme AslB (radical SAM superfamily)
MREWYCPLPFRHVFVDSTGVSPCCQTARQPTSLGDWHQDPYLSRIQQSFRDNQVDPDCQGCQHNEHAFGHSLRLDALRDYDNKQFDSLAVDFVDYRANNFCNFKCRSCDSVFSNGIAAEVRQHPELGDFYSQVPSKTVSMHTSNKEWILKNLSGIRRLMFTGGEPTIIPEVREIIEQIVHKQYKHLQIMITSNGSFVDDFWRDLTSEHHNLHWTISVDAVGAAAAVIRHGSDWQRVKDNVEWLAQHSQSLDINTVVTNLNVLQLKPLLRFVRATQLLSRSPTGRHGDLGLRHQFFVCQDPYHLSATNWPTHDRPTVLAYLDSCLALDLDSEQHNMVQRLHQAILDAEFDQDQWQRGETLNVVLDKIRGQNHLELRLPHD